MILEWRRDVFLVAVEMFPDNPLGQLPSEFVEAFARQSKQDTVAGRFCLDWMFKDDFFDQLPGRSRSEGI